MSAGYDAETLQRRRDSNPHPLLGSRCVGWHSTEGRPRISIFGRLAEPALLCYSYELRLRPRVSLLSEARRARLPDASPEELRATLPPVRLLTSASNDEFCAVLGVGPAALKEAMRVGRTSVPWAPRRT